MSMVFVSFRRGRDDVTARQILVEKTPAKAKELGRQIKGFNDERWAKHRARIVHQGNLLKFQQNPELREWFEAEGKNDAPTFVEASPYDKIWGIGYRKEEALSHRLRWGKNLLGSILTTLWHEMFDIRIE